MSGRIDGVEDEDQDDGRAQAEDPASSHRRRPQNQGRKIRGKPHCSLF